MDYKKLMGYGDTKKVSKPKVNEVLNSIKEEFGYVNEGPALQKSYLDFYETLRKKGLNDEAADFLDNYKKNIVGFTKKYKKDFGKLM